MPPALLAGTSCLPVGLGARGNWPVWLRWLMTGVAAAAGAAMVTYCFLFWIGLVNILMLPFGVPLTDGWGIFRRQATKTKHRT